MLRRANPNTIQDKVLVGYQGWFTCAGDGPPLDPGHHGWLHWFNSPVPSGGRPNIDLWPDTTDYDTSELYPAPGLATPSGDPVHLFSSRHPKTVQRHFHWMALHGVDGAFLQRFAGQCEIKPGNIAIRNLRDEIGDRVREAAEATGRVYAIMYDVSGVSPDKIQSILEQDWTHLIRDKQLLDSPNYLRENGRPVVALWGFGLNGRNHTPALVRAIAGFFRSFTPGGVYLVAGAPGHWRTSTSDADRNPEFVQVWTECFDAISPWTVGRFGNEEEADRWGQGRLRADAEYLRKLELERGRKVDYIPVVLPGGSGFNLSEGKWRMNDMRRNGGRFLWRQIYNAQRARVRTIYGAMWDEYDEGTVFMPVVSRAAQLPVHPSFRFLALDVDGHDLPSDWYMRIAGLAAEAFHGERTLVDTLPIEELQHYWSTRPRYETLESVESVAATGNVDNVEGRRYEKPTDVDAVTHSIKALEISQSPINIRHDAPPPYSLEYASPQQEQQRRSHVQAPASGAGMFAPSVRRDTRPSPSFPPPSLMAGVAAAAAIPLAADAVAYTLPPSITSSPSSSALPKPSPPPINMSSRPALPPPMTRPSYQPSEIGSPPLAYDARRQHTPTYSLPYEHGRGPSGGGVVYAPPAGPPPASMGAEYSRGRGRGRSRSRSRSKSRSRSWSPSRRHRRSRSRSRSSSGSRKGGPQPVGGPHGYAPLRGHAQSLGHPRERGRGYGQGYGYGRGPEMHPDPHAPGLGYSHTFSAGSPPPPPFLGAGAGVGRGMYDAYGGGGGHGHYTPVHSHPVGYGHDMGHGQPQGYVPGPPGGYAGGPYTQNPVPQPDGYAYGQGQGQGQGQGYAAPGSGPQQGYGYTPHPSSEYYPPYAPGPYPAGGSGSVPPGGGGGGGGVQGGFATALNKVEGIAGKQTRQQVEKTVGSLLNKFR